VPVRKTVVGVALTKRIIFDEVCKQPTDI